MNLRLALFGAMVLLVSTRVQTAAQAASPLPSAANSQGNAQAAPASGVPAAAAPTSTPAAAAPTTAPGNAPPANTGANASAIRFEDATDASGIDFVHSFGSAQLGSLLEGTGAGCAWFDYNNSGLPSLYVVNGRPLDDSMHPYPLKQKPNPPPHNHLYRNDGNGRFTDVTEKAGLNPDMYSVAVTAGEGRRLGHQLHLDRLRPRRLPGSVRRPLREVRSQVPRLLRGGQLSRAARLRGRNQHALPQ